MIIRSVKHKGLRRLMEHADASGLQPQVIDEIRKIPAFLQDMERVEEPHMVPALEGSPAYR